jgi:hypothetical protein
MTDPAEAFADQVAARRGASVVRLPTPQDQRAWAIVAPSGAHVLLVQSHAYDFGVFAGSGARVERADADAQVDAAWDSPRVTMTEALVAIAEASGDGRPLTMSLPSGLREINLAHGPCYVHATDRGELIAPVDGDFEGRPLGDRSQLPALVAWALERMRLQEAARARDTALGLRAEAFAQELLAKLVREVPLVGGASWSLRASPGEYASSWELLRGDTARVAGKVSVWKGEATVTAAGLEVSMDRTTVADVVESVRRSLQLFARDDLVEGARYRLLEPFGGGAAGDTITYVGFDPRDNHWNLEIFRGADGRPLEIDVNDRVWRRLHEVLRPLSTEEALADAEAQVAATGGDGRARVELGDALARAGRADDAMAAYVMAAMVGGGEVTRTAKAKRSTLAQAMTVQGRPVRLPGTPADEALGVVLQRVTTPPLLMAAPALILWPSALSIPSDTPFALLGAMTPQRPVYVALAQLRGAAVTIHVLDANGSLPTFKAFASLDTESAAAAVRSTLGRATLLDPAALLPIDAALGLVELLDARVPVAWNWTLEALHGVAGEGATLAVSDGTARCAVVAADIRGGVRVESVAPFGREVLHLPNFGSFVAFAPAWVEGMRERIAAVQTEPKGAR